MSQREPYDRLNELLSQPSSKKRHLTVATVKNPIKKKVDDQNKSDAASQNTKVKFEIYGEEMIEKRVKSSGNSGRVYLPPNWVGHKVKIIRTD
jgi:putative transposon-encoded protein